MPHLFQQAARFALLVWLLILLTPAVLLAQAPRVEQYTPNWRAMAQRIVERLDLNPGETVLLLGHPGRFEEIVPHLRYAVTEAGGVDLGCLDVIKTPLPSNWDMELLNRSANAQRAALKAMLQTVDVTIKLPGAAAPAPAYVALQDLLREGRGRTIHFHWDGAFPAYGQPLPSQSVIDATYQRALLETNYDAVAAVQERFEKAMRGQTIRVTTPLGTNLTFKIGDRPVNRQDGRASARRADQARILIDREIELPCGVIRVAPIEESVEGVIVFPTTLWNGRPVEGLKLTIERGRIVDFEATSGLDAFESEIIRAGSAGRAFREFGLGFNPLLAVPERSPWVPYYGYGAGVVRLSLGDNSELGGKVTGGYVRWNFFINATVTVGDDVWVQDGKLVPPRTR